MAEYRYKKPRVISSLSIVLPAYNEEENIGRVIKDALEAARLVTDDFEIIIVNDGSKDGTLQVITEYAAQKKFNIRLINNEHNQGYGFTVRTGLMAATKDWVFFTDADRQFDLQEIKKLVPFTDTSDFIVGRRINRQDAFSRLVNAKVFNLAVRVAFGIKIKDIDCAYKLMKRSELHALDLISNSAMINTEIIHKALRAGCKIKEVNVTHLPRLHGEATGAKPGVIKKAMAEFLILRWQLLHNTQALMRLNGRIVVIGASLAVVIALLWAYHTHTILAFGDAEAHLNIAKKVVSGLTPGAAQLGGIWLPLPHILMLPFVVNDWLWRSGIGGTIPSMVAFVFLCIFAYKLAFSITRNFRASYIAPLILIANPNSLYMAVTPMTEILMLAMFTASVYFFYKWLSKQNLTDLITASFFTFLATLSRYDGWALACVELAILILFLILKRTNYKRIEGLTAIFIYLSFLGIGMWLIWNILIFKNVLYFSNSIYGSKAQQMFFLAQGYLPTYHNVLKSIQFFAEDTHLVIGSVVVVAAVIGAVFFTYKSIRLKSLEYIALIILLMTPFVFYVTSLYTGQASLILPTFAKVNAAYTISNVRYGIQMLLAAGIFLAIFATRYKWLMPIIMILIASQGVAMVLQNQVITYKDGTSGLSSQRLSKGPDAPAVEAYLRSHYDNGLVLMDDYRRPVGLVESGIPMQSFIGTGDKPFWLESFDDPGKYAKWIVLQKSATDAVWSGIHRKDLINTEFVPVFSKGNLYVYEKKSSESNTVIRSGQHLSLNKKQFVIKGANSYDLLAQSASVIDQRLAAFKELKYNTVRLWCFNQTGKMDSSSFYALDEVMKQSSTLGLKVICVFGNTYNDYGGPSNFAANTPTDFFTQEYSIELYEQHISAVMNHRLPTGQALDETNTILAWELVNEPRVEGVNDSSVIAKWTTEVGEYVLTLDKSHLLSPGTEGFTSDFSGQAYNENHGSSIEDICSLDVISLCSAHLYPKYISGNGTESGLITQEIPLVLQTWRNVADRINKPIYLGEVGFDHHYSEPNIDQRSAYFTAVKSAVTVNDIDGALLWNIGESDDDHFTLASDPSNPILIKWGE